MKKILLSIVWILWIFWFVNAQSCTDARSSVFRLGGATNMYYLWLNLELTNTWTYVFSGFTFRNGYTQIQDYSLNVCFTNDFSSIVYWNNNINDWYCYVLDSYNSSIFQDYNYNDYFTTINFVEDISVSSLDYKYVVFYFSNSYDYTIRKLDSSGISYSINSDLFYLVWVWWTRRAYNMDLYNICYSFTPPLLDPKFKINYWNTSYEYTLDDNLEIHLDSPVVKNWDIYSYAWSTWINLFYNWSSQFYSKDKLYLFTPSRYSNNIFTPICL